MAKNDQSGDSFESNENELLEINMDEVAASTFTPLPAGRYEGTCSGAEFVTASSGNPMWKLTFDVPVRDEEKGVEVVRKLFDNLVWTEASLGMVKQKLNIIAPELSSSQKLNVATDHQQLIGKTVSLTVRVGTYNGMPNNQVGGYNPSGGDGF